MHVLVTGAAGFIGSHLAERLVKEGHKVTGLDSLNDYYSPALKQLNVAQLKKQGVRVHSIDLAEDDLKPFVQDVDYVFHLAAQPGISATTPFTDYLKNNIVATQRLLDAFQESVSVKGFINIATSSIYGADASHGEDFEAKPTSYYGVSKLAAEQLVLARARDKALPACSLRLFSVYGPRERPDKLYPKLIHAILSEKPFPLFEGSDKHLRSYTYVSDIVEGFIACMNSFENCNGEIINLGTDTAITTGKGIQIVEDLLGQKARLDIKPKRPGDQLKTHANITKARKLINYQPSVKPEQGLANVVTWYKNEVFGKLNPYDEHS